MPPHQERWTALPLGSPPRQALLLLPHEIRPHAEAQHAPDPAPRRLHLDPPRHRTSHPRPQLRDHGLQTRRPHALRTADRLLRRQTTRTGRSRRVRVLRPQPRRRTARLQPGFCLRCRHACSRNLSVRAPARLPQLPSKGFLRQAQRRHPPQPCPCSGNGDRRSESNRCRTRKRHFRLRQVSRRAERIPEQHAFTRILGRTPRAPRRSITRYPGRRFEKRPR